MLRRVLDAPLPAPLPPELAGPHRYLEVGGVLHGRGCPLPGPASRETSLALRGVLAMCEGEGAVPAACCGIELSLPDPAAERTLRVLDEACRTRDAVAVACQRAESEAQGRFAGRAWEAVAEAWEILTHCEDRWVRAAGGEGSNRCAREVLAQTRAALEAQHRAWSVASAWERARLGCWLRLAVSADAAREGLGGRGWGSPRLLAEAGGGGASTEEVRAVMEELGWGVASEAGVVAAELRALEAELVEALAAPERSWLLAGPGLSRLERAALAAGGYVHGRSAGVIELPSGLAGLVGAHECASATALLERELSLPPAVRAEIAEIAGALLREREGCEPEELRSWMDAAWGGLVEHAAGV